MGQPVEWAMMVPTVAEAQRHKTLDLRGGGCCIGGSPAADDPSGGAGRAALRCLAQHFDTVRFARVYVGNEFCENLIPSLSRVTGFQSFCAREGLGLSLLTPYVTDAGIEKLKPLLEGLATAGEGVEVVVNDWGVLRLVHREYPVLKPVLGRLMHRVLRDPRIAGVFAMIVPGEVKRALREVTSLTVPTFARILRQYGVSMVECDALLQGIDFPPDDGQRAIGVSVHVPYGFTTTGRSCLIGSWRLPRREKFAPGHRCSLECQELLAVATYRKDFGEARVERDFYQLGNTIFYAHDGDLLSSVLAAALRGEIQRVVFQPYLFM